MLNKKDLLILELRKKGLTQVEVSKKLGISQQAVSHFEKVAYDKISDAIRTIEVIKKIKT